LPGVCPQRAVVQVVWHVIAVCVPGAYFLAHRIVFSTIRARGANSAFQLEDVAASPDAILLSKTRARAFFATPQLAADAATRMLRELTESAFVETKFQNPDICDVYAYQATPPITAMVAGTEIACRASYVKLTLLPEHVLVVSFHPLQQPIRTVRGKKVTP
jgi:hypothetical protein